MKNHFLNRKSPFFSLIGIFMVALFHMPLSAQTINTNMFGANYWYYDGTSSSDAFVNHKTDLKAAALKVIRIGGNYANTTRKNDTDKDWYVTQINNIKSIGAIPMVQLPISLSTTRLKAWVDYFNTTKGLGIKYWCIGNEPDPSTDPHKGWYTGSVYQDGYNYTGFREQWRLLAKTLKEKDANSIIIGPDWRHFWYDAAASDPMDTYYNNFISDIGDDLASNGKPILDILSIHFYGYKSESWCTSTFAKLKTMIDAVNTKRSSKLVFCVNEVNTVTSTYPRPWEFKAGQFLMLMAKKTIAYGGQFFIPWSIYESSGSQVSGSTDFSLYNSDNTRRSTMYHLAMMSNYKQTTYMGATQSAQADNVVVFGMKGSAYTVFVMNTSESTSYTFRLKLNNTTPTGTEQVQVKLNGSVNVEKSGTIAAKTTIMYQFSNTGTLTKTLTYTVGSYPKSATLELFDENAIDMTNQFNVYPNPVAINEFVNVDYNATTNERIRVYDLSGKEVASYPTDLTGSLTINVADFKQPGLYIFKRGSSQSKILIK